MSPLRKVLYSNKLKIMFPYFNNQTFPFGGRVKTVDFQPICIFEVDQKI